MASIIPRPLSRFRKQDPADRRLHERWGDVSISAPTDGSWNQFSTPHHQSTHHHHNNNSNVYGPGYVPEHHAPSRSTTTTSSKMSTFHPRRLSMRLAPRTKTPTPTPTPDDQPPSPTGSYHPLIERPRPEFAYRPIHQDYPAEVASTTTHRMSVLPAQPSPRFRYIPASSSSSSSGGTTRSSSTGRSSVRDSVQTVWPSEYMAKEPRCRESFCEADSDDDRSRYRRSVDYSVGQRYSGGAVSEKKKKRATRTLTMTMVPDSEDIYG